MTLEGKTKFLGAGLLNGAYGPLIAIPKNLLERCRLILTTDSWLAESDMLKGSIEKHGCGLRLLSVTKNERGDSEAIYEVIGGEKPGTISIGGFQVNLPEDAYILATPFVGEFFINLEAEDSDGNRIYLWSDDYIYK